MPPERWLLYQSSVYSIIWSRLPILTLTLPVISVVLRCWLKTVPLQPEHWQQHHLFFSQDLKSLNPCGKAGVITDQNQPVYYTHKRIRLHSISCRHIMSMLVEESSSPVRATNSGLENTKKPDYPSGFFVPVVWLYFRFFPFIWGIFLSFFVAANTADRVGQQNDAVTGIIMNPVFSVSCSIQSN